MKITGKFLNWLMSLTTMMRYFVVAVLVHVAVLFILGSIKIVSQLPQVLAVFNGGTLPPQPKDDMDPFTPLREFEYNGTITGNGQGTPGKGPGGVPTAAGTTPTAYQAKIASPETAAAADAAAVEVIGVPADTGEVLARVQSGAIGMAPPLAGMGEGKFESSGVKGPGGRGFAPFSNRAGPMRAKAIRDHHGSEEAEKAVLAALRWLKEHQDEDGSWGPIDRDEVTALAVLCFLGHGETLDNSDYGLTLSKGLTYLINLVGTNGVVKSGRMHAQGVVTFALSEGYVMTQSPRIREPLENMVAAITDAQDSRVGGWRYNVMSDAPDVAVTGWVMMGMTSAKTAGLTISNEVCSQATQYLWNTYAAAEGAGYNLSPEQRYNATSIDILCQQLLGNGRDKRLRPALDYFKRQKMNWDEPGIGNLYGWYYVTQDMFQGRGEYWDYWNKEMRDTLVKAQTPDGHWNQPGHETVGLNKGAVFSTTLCCLMLEVYYRYLPLYQEMERSAPAAAQVEMPLTIDGFSKVP